MLPIKIKISSKTQIPAYQSSGSSGADVFACLEEPVEIKAGEVKLIPTGMSIEIPEGYEAQMRPRSGLALKHGVTLLNTPGTIDSDYRGEIKIIVANFGSGPFVVENQMRIAQMIFCKVYRAEFIETEDVNKTDRNDGGFGHTGL